MSPIELFPYLINSLKERPDVDLFKAIFEDDEEDTNPDEENKNEDESNDYVVEEQEHSFQQTRSSPHQQRENSSEIIVLPSSINKIDLSQIDKYIRSDNEEKSKVNEFSKMIEQLCEKSSNSSSSSQSSSEESDGVEIVYEEVSISNSDLKKTSHKGKKKKNKKKKKHHKKKSKKSHKKE